MYDLKSITDFSIYNKVAGSLNLDIGIIVTNQLDDRINVYDTQIAENDIPSEHGFLSN